MKEVDETKTKTKSKDGKVASAEVCVTNPTKCVCKYFDHYTNCRDRRAYPHLMLRERTMR